MGRLAARGHDVHLLASGWHGAPAAATLDGLAVHRVGSRYGFALRARGAFRRLAAALRPDVVVEDVNKVPLNLPQLWPGPFALLVPHLFGTTAFRELPAPLAAVVWAAERPMARVYRRAAVQAISASTKDALVGRGFRADQVRVIYPGVDTARYTPEPALPREPAPTFLYVGRLKRYKQVDVAIRALGMVRARFGNARLLIAGTGDDQPRLERLAGQHGVRQAVEFLGYVTDERKIELYRRSWAVVLPSLKEGWGITNLEAAGCGTPAVAADNSALRESVKDGVTGYLVATGDAAALADRLVTLASDPALLARLGSGARSFAESLSWERTAEETESHLHDAVAVGAAVGRET